ncbi:hypothetical protein QR685DRAFT_570146 [Neurospora intermedia]|uniref:Uncharacterized protein n=1 Tax=Neurospora intermedia TaxID=5142 RepID=A0ABR3DGD0_NEUIN
MDSPLAISGKRNSNRGEERKLLATLNKRRMPVSNAGNLEPEFEGVLQFADRGASNSSPPLPKIALAVKKDVECHKSRARYPMCRAT